MRHKKEKKENIKKEKTASLWKIGNVSNMMLNSVICLKKITNVILYIFKIILICTLNISLHFK